MIKNQKQNQKSRWGIQKNSIKYIFHDSVFYFDSIVQLRRFRLRVQKELAKFRKRSKIELNDDFTEHVEIYIAESIYKKEFE